LYVDDALPFSCYDLPKKFHYELNFPSCKFGRPSDCLPYLGAYFNSNHPELTLPE
jgi:hypothetical protein